MDVTITFDEVYALVGTNIPSLEPRPNFERIRKLRRHFENALQRLPCPQSVQHGWKGMVMAQNMYALLTTTPFRLPISPGDTPKYVRVALLGEQVDTSPLTRTEQATIDSTFARRKHYFLSMQNIERACFTALNSSVNDAFKLSNLAGIRGWHAGMTTVTILDQLSSVYGKPTSAALDTNDTIFCSPYSAADAPEVLFRRIEDCAEIATLGDNPYTDKQLILTAVRHLLTTGLYIRAFEDWDQLSAVDQTWVELRQIIQDAFERRLNATAPTAGHQGYAPALPYMRNNAFGAFGPTADTDNEDSVDTIATQMQSQLTATTAANSSQRHKQGMQALAQQQQLLHANQHQILEQLAALSFNASDAGQGIRHGGRGGGGRGTPPPTYVQAPTMPTTYQQGYGGCGRGRGRGRSGRSTQHQYSPGGFPHTQGLGDVFPPTYAMPPPAGGGGNMYNYAPQGGIPGNAPQGGMQQQERPPYSNLVKRFANWNACYTCGFDVPDGHTSMTCQAQRKVGHDVCFTRQNARQYIDAGRNCSTRNYHKTQFPAM